MSESESERDSPNPADEGAIFAYDKYYHSAKDKAEIMAMPEIQREEIIAERAAQVERQLQDMALRRLLASREREEARAAEKKKRKAGTADLEESQRKSTRQRTTIGGRRAGEASSAIEAYKRQREEKGLRDEQRRREAAARAKERAERGGSPEKDFSDADAEGESEVEWDDPKSRRRSPSPPKDDPLAELNDIQHIRIGRDNFAEVCFYPGFEEAITDCYTRICIGPGPNGANVYRLAKIIGFTKGRPYAMPAVNGRMIVTDQYVIAAHGKAERSWPFIECSNQRFTDVSISLRHSARILIVYQDEWRRYRAVIASENINLPTKPMTLKKLDQINKLIKHHFTSAEIDAKISRQNGLIDLVNRVPERREIKERRQQAMLQGDDAAVQACNDELAALVPMKLAFGTSLSRTAPPSATAPKKEGDRLAEINRRNQQLNAENVRKAQILESRIKRVKLPQQPSANSTPPTAAKPSDTTSKDTKGNGLLKPFAAIDDELFGTSGDERSRAATPITAAASAAVTPKQISTPELVASIPVVKIATTTNSDGAKPKKKLGGFSTLAKKKQAEEEALLESLDFGIDIEI